MTTAHYSIVDVFTDTPLAGNPLAVFGNARRLDTDTMQALARELNLSETTFVLPPENGGTARVRIFTPRAEIPFAGHPTLGTAAVLAEACSGQQSEEIVLELPVGNVHVRFESASGNARFGWFARPAPTAIPFPDANVLMGALGVRETSTPVGLYDNGMRHAVVQLASPADLLALAPNLHSVAKLPVDTVDVFCLDGPEARLRVFAPAHGVPEDPATGSAAAPVLLHLITYAAGREIPTLTIRQGDHLHRPSRIHVRKTEGNNGARTMIEVGGSVVTIGEGEFRIPHPLKTAQRTPRQGEIYWLAPEALRPSVQGVAHPHVVIQQDVLNHSRIPTAVVCGISSNQKRAHEPGNVTLDAGEGGLAQASVVIVSQISTVNKDALREPIGHLSPERIQQIVAGLRFQQASFFDQ